MLNFRYTCLRHQELFTALLRSEGCCDLTKMDEVRRRALSWLSEKYPVIVFEHFARESCIGCDLEASQLGLGDTIAALRALAGKVADPA